MALLDSQLNTLENVYLNQTRSILKELEVEREYLLTILKNENFTNWYEGSARGREIINQLLSLLSSSQGSTHNVEQSNKNLKDYCDTIQTLIEDQRRSNSMSLY